MTRTPIDRVEIQPLRPGELARHADLLGRALCDAPLRVAALRRTPAYRARVLSTLFSQALDQPTIRGVSALVGGRVVGVCGVGDYGRCDLPPRKMIATMGALLFRAGPAAVRAVAVRGRGWRAHHPTKAHVHVGPIGVDPTMQGRGIGSGMLESVCAQLDADRHPGYLETDGPDNVRLYERFGFSVIDRAEIHGLPNWFMWRDAK
jgi:GNAT superfamily N-acetyltransferase